LSGVGRNCRTGFCAGFGVTGGTGVEATVVVASAGTGVGVVSLAGATSSGVGSGVIVVSTAAVSVSSAGTGSIESGVAGWVATGFCGTDSAFG